MVGQLSAYLDEENTQYNWMCEQWPYVCCDTSGTVRCFIDEDIGKHKKKEAQNSSEPT